MMSLIDARKKFAQFQSEFGRKFEQEAQTKVGCPLFSPSLFSGVFLETMRQ